MDTAVTESDIKEVFGWDEEQEIARQQARLEELTAARDRAREEALERTKQEQERFRKSRRESVEGFEREVVDFDSGTQDLIREICDDMRDFLLDKNAQYGDSAIDPVRIFSKASPVEQLLVRIDDKLSRIEKGDDRIESDDDVIDDLIGYFILLKVAKRKGLS
jgi:hypothetical protein